MKSLLFRESPLLVSAILLTIIVMNNRSITVVCTIILVMLIFFYRYFPIPLNYEDNVFLCPADGVIQYIRETDDFYNFGIFLGIHNIHIQIYPVNGVVIDRCYDKSGKFELVMDLEKSKHNEKKIHTIKTNNNKLITVSQIAGFLPRAIVSDTTINKKVNAGMYLGMIKFGSRVDVSVQKPFHTSIRVGDRVHIGDRIATI